MFKNPFESEIQKLLDDEVNIDKKLKLSQENLTELIGSQISVVKLPKSEKLRLAREFPSAQTFALLAWKVYEDLGKEKLPDGWKLLTIATNNDLSNGYVGAAFLHPENHHVVVAHRGTEPTNVGSVVTDLAGIVFNNYAGQLESAITFVDKVVDAMKTVENENEGDVNFELFITGHSLGAWLSQVSVFSNMFLTKIDDKFKRVEQETDDRYHANAVVFDSPGAFPMLLKMKSKFEDPENPIVLENLSITSYLSAPNQVNTCNEHFGKVFRVFVETSNMNFLHRNVGYTLMTHSIENIVKAFGTQGETRIEEVLEWPLREGLTGGQDLENFLKHADHRNRYHIGNKIKETAKKIRIRYRTKKADKTLNPISIFSKREKQFLEHFRWIKQLPEYLKLKAIFYGVVNNSAEIEQNLACFDIVDQNIHIDDTEKMKFFIPFVKLLLKLFPGIAEKAQKLLADASIRAKIFAFESEICLKQNDLLNFKPSTLDISEFMAKQFGCLKVKTGKARNGLSVVYQSFMQSNFRDNYRQSELLILNLNRFLMLHELINVKEFLETTKENFLVMVYCEDKNFTSISIKETFRKVFEALNENSQVKIIIIGESGCEYFENICAQGKAMLEENFFETEQCLSWNEMTEESQMRVLNTEVKFQGRKEKLQKLLSTNSELELSDEVLQQILNDDSVEVNMDPLDSSKFTVYETDHDKKEIKSKHVLESLENSKDILFISGMYDEDVKIIFENLKKILQPQDEVQENLIMQNIMIGAENFEENCGKLQITSLVGSERCQADFEEKCRRYCSTGKSIHWIKIKEGKLTWRKSYNFRAYADRSMKINGKVIKDTDLCKVKDKIVAVVGKPGEGKTSLLTHLAREKSNTSWIVHLNLGDVSFDNLKIDSLDEESLSAFITNATGCDSENHLQNCSQNLQTGLKGESPIHFFFDAFDEIFSEKDRGKALKLMKFIRDKTNCCVTLTSLESFKNALNDLQPTICSFEKMQRAERENLLREFWRSRFAFVWGPKKCAEIFDDEKSKFKSFAKFMLDQLDSNIEGKTGEVMGVPQQLRYLAEGFQEDFDKYIQLNAVKQKILDGLKITTIYRHYVNTKFDLYVTAKTQVKNVDQRGRSLFKSLRNFSFDSLVPQQAKELLSNSEFFSADYIILRMTQGQSPPKVLSILTGHLLTDSKCAHLRTYLNKHEELLPKTASFDINDEISQQIMRLPMITACKEGNEKIVKFLIDLVKKKSGLKNVVLGADESMKTAYDYAIENRHEECAKLLTEFLSEYGMRKSISSKF